MGKKKEALRLHFEMGLSLRQISESVGISVGSAQSLIQRARHARLSWPLPDDCSTDGQLAALLKRSSGGRRSKLVQPDFAAVHQALKRKGVTRQLLWEEYVAAHGDERTYSYPRFCEKYRAWRKDQPLSMRQTHRAGEKCFVDYSGLTVAIADPESGKAFKAQIFVGVMGASNYTYAEATESMALRDFLAAQTRMLEYFGAAPAMIVPDNLRSGVKNPCRYDPDINPQYQQWAAHYRLTVLPARPYKPRDKAVVEKAVQDVQRRVLAPLRRREFTSLASLNAAIRPLLRAFNDRPFQKMPGSRAEAFKDIDLPAMRPLPLHRYEYIEIKQVKAGVDYHVSFRGRLYSVPHQHVGQSLQVRATDRRIHVYDGSGGMIAAHRRIDRHGVSTEDEHMPPSHLRHARWNPRSLARDAEKTCGEHAAAWTAAMLGSKQHPEQGYRVYLGLRRLRRSYPKARLDSACAWALECGRLRLGDIKKILERNTDLLSQHQAGDFNLPQDHCNVRGSKQFQ